MTQFEQITKSQETLGAFLAALPVIEGPWDKEFQARFCAGCAATCDVCPHAAERNNPRWWLTLEAGGDQAAAEPLEIKITCPWTVSGRVAGTIGEFRFRAKVYREPSKCGIGGGHVIMLEIKKGTIPVCRL